jgi:hypothetical protein
MTDMSLDVQEFDESAGAEQSRLHPDKAMTLLEQAIRAYTGDYLEEQSTFGALTFRRPAAKHVACSRASPPCISRPERGEGHPSARDRVAKTHYDHLPSTFSSGHTCSPET